MHDDSPTISGAGRGLTVLRRESGYELQELAVRLECPAHQLEAYEQNAQALSFGCINKLAATLGLSPLTVIRSCLEASHPHLSEADSRLGTIVRGLEGHFRAMSPAAKLRLVV